MTGPGEAEPLAASRSSSSKRTRTVSYRHATETASAASTASHAKVRPVRTADSMSVLRKVSAGTSARAPARFKTPYWTLKAMPRVVGVVSFLSATV